MFNTDIYPAELITEFMSMDEVQKIQAVPDGLYFTQWYITEGSLLKFSNNTCQCIFVDCDMFHVRFTGSTYDIYKFVDSQYPTSGYILRHDQNHRASSDAHFTNSMVFSASYQVDEFIYTTTVDHDMSVVNYDLSVCDITDTVIKKYHWNGQSHEWRLSISDEYQSLYHNGEEFLRYVLCWHFDDTHIYVSSISCVAKYNPDSTPVWINARNNISRQFIVHRGDVYSNVDDHVGRIRDGDIDTLTPEIPKLEHISVYNDTLYTSASVLKPPTNTHTAANIQVWKIPTYALPGYQYASRRWQRETTQIIWLLEQTNLHSDLIMDIVRQA